jgi:hypothetical protein
MRSITAPPPPPRLPVDPEDLEALRSGRDPGGCFARLYERCTAWVEAADPRLPESDRVEVVIEALRQGLGTLLDPTLDAVSVDRLLRAGLEAEIDDRRRRCDEVEMLAQSASPAHFETMTAEVEGWLALEIAGAIEAIIEIALDLTPPSDRTLLVDCLGLEQLSRGSGGAEPLVTADEPGPRHDPYKRALHSFSNVLSGVLRACVLAQRIDPTTLEKAVVFVGGRSVVETLAYVADSEEPS